MSKKYFYRYREARKAEKEVEKGTRKEVEKKGKRHKGGRKGKMENGDKCAATRVGETKK